MNNPMMNMNNPMMNMNSPMMNMNDPMMNMNNPMMMKLMMEMINMVSNQSGTIVGDDNDNNKWLKIQNVRNIKFNEFYERIKNHKYEIDPKKHQNKIIINFCNEIKKEIYLNLNDSMYYLIKYMLYSVGLWDNVRYLYT